MALVVDRLVKRFGPVLALDAMDFRVEPGQIFGFLGANGAGKTTTIRIVLDLLRADAGATTWYGTPTADLARRTWGYLPEERGLYPRMTVLEQLVFFAGLYGVDRRDAVRTVREWLDLLAELGPEDDDADRTLLLAVLRGCLLDLLATGDVDRTGAAVQRYLHLIDAQRVHHPHRGRTTSNIARSWRSE